METVEIIIYITIAIIVGSMILLTTLSLANPQVYEQIKNVFTGESKQGFATVDNSSITQYLFSFWEECNFGVSPQNVTFQYTGETLSKEEFFDEVKQLRLCNTLSSVEHDCGSREDLVTQTIEPGIRTASCTREGGVGQLVIG